MSLGRYGRILRAPGARARVRRPDPVADRARRDRADDAAVRARRRGLVRRGGRRRGGLHGRRRRSCSRSTGAWPTAAGRRGRCSCRWPLYVAGMTALIVAGLRDAPTGGARRPGRVGGAAVPPVSALIRPLLPADHRRRRRRAGRRLRVRRDPDRGRVRHRPADRLDVIMRSRRRGGTGDDGRLRRRRRARVRERAGLAARGAPTRRRATVAAPCARPGCGRWCSRRARGRGHVRLARGRRCRHSRPPTARRREPASCWRACRWPARPVASRSALARPASDRCSSTISRCCSRSRPAFALMLLAGSMAVMGAAGAGRRGDDRAARRGPEPARAGRRAARLADARRSRG